jgi:hypothetical protein
MKQYNTESGKANNICNGCQCIMEKIRDIAKIAVCGLYWLNTPLRKTPLNISSSDTGPIRHIAKIERKSLESPLLLFPITPNNGKTNRVVNMTLRNNA